MVPVSENRDCTGHRKGDGSPCRGSQPNPRWDGGSSTPRFCVGTPPCVQDRIRLVTRSKGPGAPNLVLSFLPGSPRLPGVSGKDPYVSVSARERDRSEARTPTPRRPRWGRTEVFLRCRSSLPSLSGPNYTQEKPGT